MPKRRNYDRKVPFGVAVISVFMVLVGVIMVLGGLLIIAAAFLTTLFHMGVATSGAMLFTGVYLYVLGAVLVLLGIIDVILGWGLWKLRYWAWMLAIVFGIVDALLGAVTFDIVLVLVAIIVVVYLWFVRKAFR